jgi:tRNA (cmo5U34)-methyltransferase
LAETLAQRRARFEAIEESEEMAAAYHGPPKLIVADALRYDYQPFDFAVCFLTVMFLPVPVRASFLRRLSGLVSAGGALVIVDKTNPPDGYAGTALRRLTMSWKLDQGATPEQIVQKELSLSGYQRPINPRILGSKVTPFFAFGEFGGWLMEKPE